MHIHSYILRAVDCEHDAAKRAEIIYGIERTPKVAREV